MKFSRSLVILLLVLAYSWLAQQTPIEYLEIFHHWLSPHNDDCEKQGSVSLAPSPLDADFWGSDTARYLDTDLSMSGTGEVILTDGAHLLTTSSATPNVARGVVPLTSTTYRSDQ